MYRHEIQQTYLFVYFKKFLEFCFHVKIRVLQDIRKPKESIIPTTGADKESESKLLCKRCRSEIGEGYDLQIKEEQHVLIQNIESLKKLMTEEFRHINDRMDAYEAKIVSFIQSDMSYLSISIHSFIYHPYSL
jgi:hypothetical protein